MKTIKGFENYKVDKEGNIYSNKSGDWKPRKPWKSKGGYLYIELCKNGVKYRKSIHQIVAETYCEGWFEGAVINHKDSNKENNKVSNLEWVTQKENVHQTYKNSKYGATRNFNKYIIQFKNKTISPELIGGKAVERFIKENNLAISPSSLIKYKHSKGYALHVV